jgi:ABC-type multidrug transport system fused ATPase/permease subunit
MSAVEDDSVGTVPPNDIDNSKKVINITLDDPQKREISTKPPSKAASLGELFQYADHMDYLLMICGTCSAVAAGFCQPAFSLLFGYALDDLNSSGSIESAIDTLVVYIVILGAGNFVVSTLSTGCWGITGERQAQRFREKYVNAVLSQEIGWFDAVGANQLATRLADQTGQLREGMTYKLADLLQFSSQVMGAIVIGLALDPYVALIMFACKLTFIVLLHP